MGRGCSGGGGISSFLTFYSEEIPQEGNYLNAVECLSVCLPVSQSLEEQQAVGSIGSPPSSRILCGKWGKKGIDLHLPRDSGPVLHPALIPILTD